jgi:hypothetical protein
MIGELTMSASLSNIELGAINTALTGGVTPIQNGTYQTYSYTFVATSANEYLSFLFRNDPAFSYLDTVSVVAQGQSTNLLTNGGFALGGDGYAPDGHTVEPYIPIGWTAIGVQGLDCGGQLYSSAWMDGAVGGYDGIQQEMVLRLRTTYTNRPKH